MTKKTKYIYVSGPYTSSPNTNTRNALKLADQLRSLGYAPFIPHLTHFWDLVAPHSYEECMAYDLEWLEKCDGMIVIPGESAGVQREIGFATGKGIPIFYSLTELIDYNGTS